MSDTMIMVMEVSFNIIYLIIIWSMVAIMFARRKADDSQEARTWLTGFFLLALGDTGHVGFRAAAYLLGDINTMITIGEKSYSLIGIGSLATAYTVTILYMLMAYAWQIRNGKPKDTLFRIIMLCGIFRMIVMIFPQNAWFTIGTPYGWSLLRNTPLTVMGVIIALRFLCSGNEQKDQFQRNLAIAIFVSYGFYLPVILFVRFVPMLGMLMMPKTVAYLFMGWFALKEFYPNLNRIVSSSTSP